jgi:hypothetical protein
MRACLRLRFSVARLGRGQIFGGVALKKLLTMYAAKKVTLALVVKFTRRSRRLNGHFANRIDHVTCLTHFDFSGFLWR